MPSSPPRTTQVYRLAAREKWWVAFLPALLVPMGLTIMIVAQGHSVAPLFVIYGFFALIGGVAARNARRRAANLQAEVTPCGVWGRSEQGHREGVSWEKLEGVEWRVRRMGRNGVYATIGLLTHDEDGDADEITIGPARDLPVMRVVLAKVLGHGGLELSYEKPAPTGLRRWFAEPEEHRLYVRAGRLTPEMKERLPETAPTESPGGEPLLPPGVPPPPAWGSVPPPWGQ